MTKRSLKKGRYQHYKGKDYMVIGIALHTETEEELVVYEQLYEDHKLWVRPKQMFEEEIDVDGKLIPRFKYLGSE